MVIDRIAEILQSTLKHGSPQIGQTGDIEVNYIPARKHPTA
jgi:hypothetical protein